MSSWELVSGSDWFRVNLLFYGSRLSEAKVVPASCNRSFFDLNCSRSHGEDKENEEVKEDEQPKEMTLDEWKKLQENERAKSTFEIRKAGEGEKKGMWKDTKVFKRDEEDEEQFAARRVSNK